MHYAATKLTINYIYILDNGTTIVGKFKKQEDW